MDGAVETEFLDLLYEAAVEPDKWIPAMDRFADLVGGTSSWLSRLSMADGTGTGVVSRIDPVMPPLYHAYYAPQNLYSNATDPEAFMRGWTPKIMLDEDFVPKDELVKLIKELEKQMKQAAKDLEFEKAAALRDQVIELRRTLALEEQPA